MWAKNVILGAILVAGMAASVTAANAETKSTAAVAAPNFNLSSAAGVVDGDGKLILSGRGTMPLYSDAFGIQLDASDALGAGPNRGGLGLHLFNRNPAQHLIGLTTMWGRVGSVDTLRYGLEGEAYMQDFTLRLAGGGQSQQGNGTAYANAKASYYFTDNLVVGLGVSGYSDSRGGSLDLEWKPADLSTPFSVFASAGDTNDSDGFGLVGLRFSFGDNNASLKDRQRSYDPDNLVETFMTSENGAAEDECQEPVRTVTRPTPTCGRRPPP
jgi:hypothetical protein